MDPHQDAIFFAQHSGKGNPLIAACKSLHGINARLYQLLIDANAHYS